MCIKKYYFALFLLFFCAVVAYPQERRTEICVEFRVNSAVIDSTYSDNAARMREITDLLQSVREDSTLSIVEVHLCGGASPEGSDQLNRKLARGRLNALEQFIRSEIELPDSLIIYDDNHIQWDYLKSQIEDSAFTHKDATSAVLDEERVLVNYHKPNTHIDSRVVKLQKIDNGNVWKQMHKQYFPKMRSACVVFITVQDVAPVVEEVAPVVEVVEEKVEEPVVVPVDTAEVVELDVNEWAHKLYLKTNALGWAMGISNLAVEVDLAEHWSLSIPVYYSALNYFTETIKFRTLGTQPEVRYWIKPENQGLFVGAHASVASYNVAVSGDYRYQDHDGKEPAWGGGLNVGYRLPISKDNRWGVEFSLGAGVYSIHYDKFNNTADTKDGLFVESVKTVYWGFDQAAVSFSYSFDLCKKGGKK